MFNPANFSVAPKKSIAIANSAHPVVEYMPMTMKRIPKSDDCFYAPSNDNKWVATYREEDHTISVWEGSVEDFKSAWMAGEVNCDVVDVASTDTHIGNAIHREIKAMGLI